MNKAEQFIKKTNQILSGVSYGKLVQSCNGPDKSYAKEILSQMHNAFVSAYGLSPLGAEEDFVSVPCVVRSKETGLIVLGISDIDLSSSGELWRTDFLTPFGVLSYDRKDMSEKETDYLCKKIGGYDYWYTPSVENDIHIDFDDVPQEVADLLSCCSHNCSVQRSEDMNMEL